MLSVFNPMIKMPFACFIKNTKILKMPNKAERLKYDVYITISLFTDVINLFLQIYAYNDLSNYK